MASVQGKTSIKIDELVNGSVISGSVNSAGDLLLTTRGGAIINAGSVRKPFGVTWDKNTSYVTGDVVGYAGSLWKAKSDNSNKPPALFTSLWTPLTGVDLTTWIEKDPYFDGDLASEAWQFFWKSGNPVVSLTNVSGEFESGYQALKIALAASESQRFYNKLENITRGGEKITVKVRAKLLASASGSYLQGLLMQNDAAGKPEPYETGSVTVTAAEGNQSLTTSWADYTFTLTAANAKPRASIQLVAAAGSGAPATFLIDRVKVTRGQNLYRTVPNIQNFTANPATSNPIATISNFKVQEQSKIDLKGYVTFWATVTGLFKINVVANGVTTTVGHLYYNEANSHKDIALNGLLGPFPAGTYTLTFSIQGVGGAAAALDANDFYNITLTELLAPL